jgi:hypothetical protein
MPERKTKGRKSRAKSPSTKAGKYVHEEIEHVRQGKHGARSAKQAIAIGLSKARKAGVKVPAPPGKRTPKAKAGSKTNAKRSRASTRALKREGSQAASHEALSKHARSAARGRGATKRSTAAKKGARTKTASGRKQTARKAAAKKTRRAA